ncbi:MAG: hypothetical protein CL811_09195 [Colwelliaceae bacterium]|nr:hypothetical protein [Colwelliaceae bacterium]
MKLWSLPSFLLILIFATPISFIAIAQDEAAEENTNQEAAAQEKTGEQSETTPNDSASEAAKIEPPVSLIEQFTSDIERSVSQELVTPMLAGTENFLTITQPDSHQSDKGVAILLPEWSQPATDARAINFLRQHLPTEGWTTITVQPLLKPEGYPSLADRQALADEENQKIFDDYQSELTTIMTSVMEKAAEYPGIFLVVAQGNNAAMLADLYSEDKVDKPNAFVTLSAHLLTPQDNKNLADTIADSDIPTLDIILKRDNLWVEHFAETRLRNAKRALKPYYRQRELTNFRAGYYPSEALAKEIKGWLTTIGW